MGKSNGFPVGIVMLGADIQAAYASVISTLKETNLIFIGEIVIGGRMGGHYFFGFRFQETKQFPGQVFHASAVFGAPCILVDLLGKFVLCDELSQVLTVVHNIAVHLAIDADNDIPVAV